MDAPSPRAKAEDAMGDELDARATALVPQLLDPAAEADRLRRMPDANVAALQQAGLLKVLQPRRFGGWQASLRTHLDVVSEIARGCASTGWCLGVMHAHSWLMSLFPPAAQQDTFGHNADAIISAVITPHGTARATQDGYILNGFWPFASGVEHADWLFLGAVVQDAGGGGDRRGGAAGARLRHDHQG